MKIVFTAIVVVLSMSVSSFAQRGKWEVVKSFNTSTTFGYNFSCVSCYNDKNCIIGGNKQEYYSIDDPNNGYTDRFFRTTDGGETWTAQGTAFPKRSSGNRMPFIRKVRMIDSLHAVAIGDSGRIVTTNDGGTTWIERDSKTKWLIAGVAFYDKMNGIAIGGFQGVYRITSDGGVTWQERPNLTLEAQFIDVVAPAPHTYYIFDYAYTKMLRTFDDGQTWDTLPVFKNNLLNSTKDNKSITAASFNDAMNGWIVGVNYSQIDNPIISPYIARTKTGGLTWKIVYFSDNSLPHDKLFGVFSFKDVISVSPKSCIAVGRVNAVLRTEDDGENWTREQFADSTKQELPLSIAVANKNLAFIASQSGRFFSRQFPTTGVTSKTNEDFNQYFWITTMPIPASSSMEVTLYGLFSVKNALLSVKVYNIMGVEVADYSTAANAGNDGTISRFTADVSKLSGGVYVLRYSAGGFTKSGLFVVTR